jgi:hypothetical protein
MEVRLFPNSGRPHVGLKPRREGQRPLLPQHARHCPVLEAGSALGFLVYPPVESNESFHIEYEGDGRYRLTYFLSVRGKAEAVFSVGVALPIGSTGMMKADVAFTSRTPPISKDTAISIARTLIAFENLGTPPGALALRGSTNFQTPPGWDTVYTPIFNMIERPVAPMLVVRVETDWYAHETEFRYVLEPGEGISGEQGRPIGQVLFVPREQITLRDCTEQEFAAVQESQAQFSHQKAALKVTTAYGLQYSPCYLRQSRGAKT